MWLCDSSPYLLSRWIFLRALGLIYLIAFLSLWSQIGGLVGQNGILPAGDYLQAVRAQLGPERYWFLPSLFWLNASEGALNFICAAGMLFSLLLACGIAPFFSLIFLWAFYLSLSGVCREFLSFQWDILLLETGFLAILFAPFGFRPRLAQESPPSKIVLWLLRLLLFKLMFSSAVVKLSSGDPNWRNLTALSYHYETQPLSTWSAWFMHQMPLWFHKASVLLMFFIEGVAPFGIFAPRKIRFISCAAMAGLQLLILATGNYCFFNLLALALCLLLLDDAFLRKFFPARFHLPDDSPAPWRYREHLLGVFAALIIFLSGIHLFFAFSRRAAIPESLGKIIRWASPFRAVNGYGLFAVMTTSRPEIIVEGSRDGKIWLAYEFKWKPGDVKRRPQFVAPHQPRLDWQMWFAALGNYQSNPWFTNFLGRLLQGKREVLELLETNPFPDKPPRYVRALLYDYRFTNFEEKKKSGAWWKRELKGLYCPVLSLR